MKDPQRARQEEVGVLSKVLLTEITKAQREMAMVLAKYAGWLSEEYRGRALEVLWLARYLRKQRSGV